MSSSRYKHTSEIKRHRYFPPCFRNLICLSVGLNGFYHSDPLIRRVVSIMESGTDDLRKSIYDIAINSLNHVSLGLDHETIKS